MRIVAILAAYNEERFIGPCLENLFHQGLEAYLLDNGSRDQTVEIADSYRHSGLIDIETIPHGAVFDWKGLLERKDQLARTLQADWFVHMDPDEIRLPPRSDTTLAQAFADADKQGYNAVNFLEFAFTPTRESPDHDHPNFQQTMRWYYPFLPSFPHRLNAWKKQPTPVQLAASAGHQVKFPGLRMYPESFPMRHYLLLSKAHAIRKYVQRPYDPVQVAKGWDVWRSRLTPDMIELPSEMELRTYVSDDRLDASHPRTQHYLAELVLKAKGAGS
jgi:glycosyltransferase involved in cell wall biosynthesis